MYFNDSDGWLFATLKLMNKRKLNLNSILITGDNLNHALFSLDEINNGLSRFECEGFIEFVGTKMLLTTRAKNFIKTNHKMFESCIDEQVRYRQLFKEIQLQNKIVFKEYFNQSEYDFAIKNYKLNI